MQSCSVHGWTSSTSTGIQRSWWLGHLNLSPVLENPVRNIVPNLVYAGTGHEVKTAIVAGKVLVHDGEVLTADEAAVRAKA